MAISSGSLARVYAKKEASFGTAESLVNADYVETNEASVNNDPWNFEPSPEKTPGQDLFESHQRRPTTQVRTASNLRGAPSGTTKPEIDAILAAAMGRDSIEVDAADDVEGAGNAGRVLFVTGAGDGMLRPQVGGTNTPLIATDGAASYGSINYNLGDEQHGVTLRYQPPDAGTGAGAGPGTAGAPTQLASGWAPTTLTLAIDGTAETVLTVEGPAARTVEGAGAGTDIADAPPERPDVQPPTGMVGKAWFRVGAGAARPTGAFTEMPFAFRTLNVTMNLPKMLRNDEFGSTYARGSYINGRRETTVELMTWAEEGNPLFDALRTAKAADPSVAPYVSLFIALGDQAGARAGVYLPAIRFTLPSGADGAEGIAHTFTGRAHGASYGDGNSSLAIGLA